MCNSLVLAAEIAPLQSKKSLGYRSKGPAVASGTARLDRNIGATIRRPARSTLLARIGCAPSSRCEDDATVDGVSVPLDTVVQWSSTVALALGAGDDRAREPDRGRARGACRGGALARGPLRLALDGGCDGPDPGEPGGTGAAGDAPVQAVHGRDHRHLAHRRRYRRDERLAFGGDRGSGFDSNAGSPFTIQELRPPEWRAQPGADDPHFEARGTSTRGANRPTASPAPACSASPAHHDRSCGSPSASSRRRSASTCPPA